MKFKFSCELCKKEVKQGEKFTLDIFEKETDITGGGVECIEAMCFSCKSKIVKKIDSLNK